MIDFLMKAGAIIKDIGLNETTLHHFVRVNEVEAIMLVTKFIATSDPKVLDESDSGGHIPIIVAAENGYDAALHVLIKAGADVNNRQGLKPTALH